MRAGTRLLVSQWRPSSGLSYRAACLFPSSAMYLFGTFGVQQLAAEGGLHFGNLGAQQPQHSGFSASVVLQMLVVDVVLYGLLTWYCDRVSTSKDVQLMWSWRPCPRSCHVQ